MNMCSMKSQRMYKEKQNKKETRVIHDEPNSHATACREISYRSNRKCYLHSLCVQIKFEEQVIVYIAALEYHDVPYLQKN